MLLLSVSKIFITEIGSGILNKEIKREKKPRTFWGFGSVPRMLAFKEEHFIFCRDASHLLHPFINFVTKLQNAEKCNRLLFILLKF